MIKLYTDAASPAYQTTSEETSGAGLLIIQNHHQHQLKQIVASGNNHEAEFLAAIAGFEAVKQLAEPTDTIMFFTDSRLVADAVGKGVTKHYRDLTKTLLALQDGFQLVVTEWIPERQNHGAHQLALQALHHQS
ncbi:ribonuclease HI [Furfurilactobacillus curtus]|uniref:Ribonuclease HI n=2 Tax=Furfurilactobacillus curtus TaxID=1746200 RepID=A0ABQ5JR88_9LACO